MHPLVGPIRVFTKRHLSIEEFFHVVSDDTNKIMQESEISEDEVDSSKPAEDVQKMYTENLFEDPTTAEVESTTPADNLNIQGNGDTMIAILKTSFRKTK